MTTADAPRPTEAGGGHVLEPSLATLVGAKSDAPVERGWQLHDVHWSPGRECQLTYRIEANGHPSSFVAIRPGDAGWVPQRHLEDPALPGLVRASDPALVAERLSRVCGRPVRSCTVEPQIYRPGSRCVLRYDVVTDTGRQSFVATHLQPETFARLTPMAVALAGRPGFEGLVPRLGEIWSDVKTLVTWAVGGRSVAGMLADSRIPTGERVRLGYRLGETLGRFHRQSGVTAPAWSEDDQLAELDRALAAVDAADPVLAARLRGVLDALATRVPCSGQHVLSHGSFRPDRVVVTGPDRLTALDIDRVTRSDPARDLGTALARLRWQGIRQPAARHALRGAELLLVAGYEQSAQPVDPQALLWWRAAELLALAAGRYQRLEVQTWSQTPALAAAAESLLALD